MATALIAPTEHPEVLASAGLTKLAICFSSLDDWNTLVVMAGRLALPANAAVDVCYKALTNLHAIGGTFSGHDSPAFRLIPFPDRWTRHRR